MFNALCLSIDVATNLIHLNKTLSIWFWTISLSLLILSIAYINMKNINFCDFKRPENVCPVQYNDPRSNFTGGMTDFTDDSYLNFFPDVHKTAIISDQDHDHMLDPPKLVQPKVFESANSVGSKALVIGNMVKTFKQMKNTDKALKCFHYALAQNPHDHDALLYYGEFLETIKDFINADHFYLKALMLRPENSRALVNRERTKPIVAQLDHEELKRIDCKRDELIALNKKNPNLKQLKKALYFLYIHHTVALEGNTMSCAEVQKIVETKLPVSGKSIIEYNEILGIESALHYVTEVLLNNNRDIHIRDILEIHKRVLGRIDPLTAGTFRDIQVYVGKHQPPAPLNVELLMEEFVKVLRMPHVRKMHPIYIAAFIHHNLVLIHPFLDGNGRTARLLMNLIALRYGYPPIIIRKGEKSQYHQLLQTANESDHRPFYRFIAHAVEYTIDVFLRAHECEQSALKALESAHDITDVIPLSY